MSRKTATEGAWSPFLEDGSLPVRWESVPYLAPLYDFEEVRRMMRVRSNCADTIVSLRKYYDFFKDGLYALEKTGGFVFSGGPGRFTKLFSANELAAINSAIYFAVRRRKRK